MARALGLLRVLLFSLLPAACSLLPTAAAAQTRTVEILGADQVSVTQDSAGVVRRLDGNVRLRQDTTALSARSAVYDEARSEVVLRGDVRIVSGRNTLTADEVVYRSDTRVAEARSRVRVADDRSVLTAPNVTHDTQTEVSTFSGGGRITHRGSVITSPAGTYASGPQIARLDGPVRLVDSTGTVAAARGTYDARVQRADFAGTVRLRRPDVRLAADSLVYFRRTERARAYGRVALERIGSGRTAAEVRRGAAPADSSRRTFLFGESLLYDGRTEAAQARGVADRDPLLATLAGRPDGGVDTTLVRAPRLDAARTILRTVAGADTLQTLTATGGARVVDRRLAAVADSARVVRSSTVGGEAVDRIGLYGAARPSAWADGAQLTGDSVFVSLRAERVDTLLVVGRAFSARVDSVLGRVQQLAGGRMQAFFVGDSAGGGAVLRRVSVWPNAEAVSYRADAEGRLAGADRLSADSLSVVFDAGEVREVRGYGGGGEDRIVGTTWGPRIVPDNLALPGFAFDPAGAPTRAGVLDPDGWEAAFLADFGPTPEALRPLSAATPTAAPAVPPERQP